MGADRRRGAPPPPHPPAARAPAPRPVARAPPLPPPLRRLRRGPRRSQPGLPHLPGRRPAAARNAAPPGRVGAGAHHEGTRGVRRQQVPELPRGPRGRHRLRARAHPHRERSLHGGPPRGPDPQPPLRQPQGQHARLSQDLRRGPQGPRRLPPEPQVDSPGLVPREARAPARSPRQHGRLLWGMALGSCSGAVRTSRPSRPQEPPVLNDAQTGPRDVPPRPIPEREIHGTRGPIVWTPLADPPCRLPGDDLNVRSPVEGWISRAAPGLVSRWKRRPASDKPPGVRRHRTTNTGHRAPWRTRSLTLPKINPPIWPSPRLPTTMRSARSSSAARTISPAGSPVRYTVVTRAVPSGNASRTVLSRMARPARSRPSTTPPRSVTTSAPPRARAGRCPTCTTTTSTSRHSRAMRAVQAAARRA